MSSLGPATRLQEQQEDRMAYHGDQSSLRVSHEAILRPLVGRLGQFLTQIIASVMKPWYFTTSYELIPPYRQSGSQLGRYFGRGERCG